MTSPLIVVLTPLKNDAWILRRFLEVTSQFADLILVADQGSTDGGLEICAEFGKVVVIDNSNSEYDEASRQQLLISEARKRVPLPRLLMALDSDEILTADSIDSEDWDRMLKAPPGTAIFFEKPNLHMSPFTAERRPLDFLGAFMDDDVARHEPRRVHSPRLPAPQGSPRLVLQHVKFMHYALARPQAQKAKIRMYAVLENLMGTKSAYWRRRYYWSRRVFQPLGRLEATPRSWFEGWERRGIDMTNIQDEEPYWQDLATLNMLLKYGSLRFWFDDIWEKDWPAFLAQHPSDGVLHPPPRLFLFAVNGLHLLLEGVAALRRRLFHADTE